MISFVVPAHNEARVIGETLHAIALAADAVDIATSGAPPRQTGVHWEVLVVDDASSDATAGIARGHGARVLRVEHRHIAATRNAGAAAARGDVLVFVDADTLIDTSVLRAALQALRRGAVGGGAAVMLRGRLALHERALVRLSVVGFRLARIAPGCFVFCTRAAFEAAGGFDETYYAGEDVAISRALARQGEFVVLREAVRTSARKLRTFSALEHLRLMLRFAWRGRAMLRSRRDLGLWYGERRDE